MKKHRSIYIGIIGVLFVLLCVSFACGKAKVAQVDFPAAPTLSTVSQQPIVTPGISITLTADTPVPDSTDTPAFTPVPTESVSGDTNPSPVPEGEEVEKYVAGDGVVTVGWISDTQHYANTFPEIYPTITSFLYDHREELNLAYVVHTGDLVHQNGSKSNWSIAADAMALLHDIPYGVLAGNHDMNQKEASIEHYSEYFGEKFFKDRPWYGESFENNRCHYDLITIGNTDYIFVYLSFKPNDKAMQFVKDSFDKYPDRIGILCVHEFMTSQGEISKDGKKIREKIVSKCPNCYMVLCGHRYGLYCLTDAFDDNNDGVSDRTVYEMMMNYQSAGKEGGSGYFRLMQFNDELGTIRILTYSAYLNDYNWLDDPSHNEVNYMMDSSSEEFTLQMPWRA